LTVKPTVPAATPCGKVAVAVKLMLSVVVTVAAWPWIVAVTPEMADFAVNFRVTVLPGTMRFTSVVDGLSDCADVIDAVEIIAVDAVVPYRRSSDMLPNHWLPLNTRM